MWLDESRGVDRKSVVVGLKKVVMVIKHVMNFLGCPAA